MICNNCSFKSLCIAYADISKHSAYTNISINQCNYCTDMKAVSPNRTTAYQPYPIKKEVDTMLLNKLSNNNLKEQQEKAKTIKNDKPKVKLELKAEPLKMDRKCKSCKAQTFKEDIGKCDNCGKELCSCCATVDGDTKKILCEKCWKEL